MYYLLNYFVFLGDKKKILGMKMLAYKSYTYNKV